MAPFQYTLHAFPFPQAIIMIVTSTQHVLVYVKSHASRQKHNIRQIYPRQERSDRQDLLKANAKHALLRMQVIAKAFTVVHHVAVVAWSRNPRQARNVYQPHSQQEPYKSTALHILPYLDAITTVASLLYRLFVVASSNLRSQDQNDRRPHSHQDRHTTTTQLDEQFTTFNAIVSVAMHLQMHWIHYPASYSMMQHQSHVALYRESAMANTVFIDELGSLLTLPPGDETGHHLPGIAQVTSVSAQRPVEYHLGREATPHCTPHCAQTPWYWFIITTVDLSDFDRTASAHQQSQGIAELEFTIDGTHGFDRMTTPLPPGLEVTVHVNVTTGYEYLEGPDVYLEPFKGRHFPAVDGFGGTTNALEPFTLPEG